MTINKVGEKCGAWQRITIIYVTYVQRNISDSNFNKAVIDKISNFHEIAPKFHIFTKIIIF